MLHAIRGYAFALAVLAGVALAAPSADANSGIASNATGGARVRIVTTEFVPANSFTGDVILIARGGPFGAAKPGHGREYITDVRPTADPSTYVYVGHDVYRTSFGSIRLGWRASCSAVNPAQTTWFCGDGTWRVRAGTGAYAGMTGGGTFTNISYSDSTGASFAHSYVVG